MEDTQLWYIVKHAGGRCEIVPSKLVREDDPNIIEKWGTFASQEEAIAKRIGLIRAGKCQPL